MVDKRVAQRLQELKAEIANLYAERSELMARAIQIRFEAHSFGDSRILDDKTREYLIFEIVQLIANWDQGADRGGNVKVDVDGDIAGILSAIVELEEHIAALEGELPET
ncbi:MAG TPA: hypothetical protein VH867_06630 [Burkholderiales bacterium]|jgi:hypothetical protein